MLALRHLRLAELETTVVAELGRGDLGLRGGDLRRAIGRGPDVVPGLDVPVGGVGRSLSVELTGEVDAHTLLRSGEGDGHAGRGSSVTHALEAAILGRGSLPAAEAGHVKLSILGVEAGAHGAAAEVDVEAGHAALHLGLAVEGHFLREDAVERAGTIAEMQKSVLPRTELIGGHPDLATAGVVDILGEPAERTIVVRRRRRAMGEVDHAVEAALLHPVEAAHGRPSAFVVTGGELAGRAHPNTIGRAETSREDLELAAIR